MGARPRERIVTLFQTHNDARVVSAMAKKHVVLSGKFERIGETGLDARKRVSLSKAVSTLNGKLSKKSKSKDESCLRFTIDMNDAGQILLTPHAVHSEESWLYKNPKALASVRRGLRQLAGGKRYNLGSFVQYADDEID